MNMEENMTNHENNARVFKAFCDENRLMILSLLQNGEKCACVLLEKVNVGQSTLSHHMKILVDSGIVDARKEGKWMFYSISAGGSDIAAKLLRKLTKVQVDETDTSNEKCCAVSKYRFDNKSEKKNEKENENKSEKKNEKENENKSEKKNEKENENKSEKKSAKKSKKKNKR